MSEIREREGKSADAYLHSTVPGVFSVARGVPGGGPPRAVRFVLDRDGTINVETKGLVPERFSAKVTLDNWGRCRFLVGSEQLDEWQVLRRALEPLFFDLKDWEI